MKKVLLVAFAMCLFVGASNAQTSFGIKAGPNFANIGGDYDEGSMKIGFHIGAVANLKITDKFALSPELLFSSQGTKMDGFEVMGVSIPETKTALNYLNIPVMAKVYITEGFNIHAGPIVGFLLSAKYKSGDDDVDIKEGFKGVDFGVGFGAGYELESGLNFGARYNLGLANIAETEEGDDSSISNQVIQISVGFNF